MLVLKSGHKRKLSFGAMINNILNIRKQHNYQLFLKYFDEVCIVDENNKWVGVIQSTNTLLIYSTKKEKEAEKNNSLFKN